MLKRTTILIVMLGLMASCDQSFNPKGLYDEKLVVYSVLIAETDTHYVRVYSTYDPPTLLPNSQTTDIQINDCQVEISNGGQSIQCAKTTIVRSDKSRYSDDIVAYVAKGFRVQPGSSYVLTVNSPSRGNAMGMVTVPTKGLITLTNSFVLDDPIKYSNTDIILYAALSGITRGYIIRFCIEYEIQVNGVTVVLRDEVPELVENSLPKFPKLRRRVYNPERVGAREVIIWPFDVYMYFLRKLNAKYESSGLKLKSALFFLTQAESGFYAYYNIVNGFQDVGSIRTDEPDYTNIAGAVGIMGALTLDTLTHSLPPSIRLE